MSRDFKPGFTLIELIISVAIISILSAVIFINFSNQNQRAAVQQAANQIAFDLQKMYTQAQSGQELNGSSVLGYGLSLQANQLFYTQYVDTSGDAVYSGGAELVLQRNLPTNTRIASIQEKSSTGTLTTRTRADVLYGIPGATLAVSVVSGGSLVPTTNRIIITLQHRTLTSITQCVSITPAIGAVNLSCS